MRIKLARKAAVIPSAAEWHPNSTLDQIIRGSSTTLTAAIKPYEITATVIRVATVAV